jgi:hypothetical protein
MIGCGISISCRRIKSLSQCEGGASNNTPDRYIANIPGPDAGHYLELTAASDGGFEVLNARTNFTQKYAARP